jgi:hypothetical protein
MIENKPDDQPPMASLAAVTDSDLFRYATWKNLVQSVAAMHWRAYELRPPLLAWIRCTWYELRTGKEAADELTRRTAAQSQQYAEAQIG